MKLPVNLSQPGVGDMRVDFRGADAGVAEQFLDDAQVSAVLQQVGRKTVAQHVRRYVAGDAGTARALFHAQPECHRRSL